MLYTLNDSHNYKAKGVQLVIKKLNKLINT